MFLHDSSTECVLRSEDATRLPGKAATYHKDIKSYDNVFVCGSMEELKLSYLTYSRKLSSRYYLLGLLVKRDIKRKYKGSVLGILWSLLNPLLNMMVLTIVFSTVFHNSIHNFSLYMLTGSLLLGFFNSSTTSAMKSIVGSNNLINKVYVPKYIFTLSRVISDFVFFLISLLDLLLIMLITRATFTFNVLYAPLYLALLFIFSCGVSMILATITVFFRDIEHIYGVLTTVFVYASAIFYPRTIVPNNFQFVLTINPILYFITGFRYAVYDGSPLNVVNLAACILIAFGTLAVGAFVFKKNEDKFILYI